MKNLSNRVKPRHLFILQRCEMKAIIFILANISILLFLSCNYEQVTETPKKYDMNTILNDSNWVEIIDTIDVTDQIICLAQELIQGKGTVLQSENYYRELWEKSITEYPMSIINCNNVYVYDSNKVKYETPNVNLNERTVLGYFVITGIANTYRYIYKNDKTNEYLYLLKIRSTSPNYRGDGYFAWTSVPKITEKYSVIFDTTNTD